MVKAGDVRKALRKRRDLGGAGWDKKVKNVSLLVQDTTMSGFSNSSRVPTVLLGEARMKFLKCKSDPVASMFKLFNSPH